MLSLYYYNKVEIASVFHIHVRRMWKTHRSLHHHPRRGRACPARALSAAARYCFATPSHPYIVGRGLDPSAARRGRRPLQRWPETIPHPRTLPPPVGAGHARPATSPPPAVNLPPLTHSPKSPNPATLLPPTSPIICVHQPPSPQYTPCPNFTLKLCRKNQKNLQKSVDKGHTTCYNNQAVSRAQPAAAAAGAFTYSLYAVF